MKIIATLNGVPANYLSISGGDYALIEHTKNIQQSSNEIMLATSLELKKILDSQLKKISLTSPQFFIKNYYVMALIRISWLLKVMIKHKPDFIISGSDQISDVLPALLYTKFQKNCKWALFTWHLIPKPSERFAGFLGNYFSYLSQRFTFSRLCTPNYIFTPSNFYALKLEKMLSTKKSKILFLKPPPPKKFINQKDYAKKEDHFKQIIYVGRITPNKGISFLPEILHKVITSDKRVKLVLAGGGDKKYVCRLIKEFDNYMLTENVEFLGFISEEEKFRLYMSSDCFVLPSLEEGFSYAIQEALHAKLHVVCWEIESLLEIYDSRVLTAKARDINDFANKVLGALDIRKSSIPKYEYDWDPNKILNVMEQDDGN